eukprot:12357091-Prorocentrum_lima.AAC.1
MVKQRQDKPTPDSWQQVQRSGKRSGPWQLAQTAQERALSWHAEVKALKMSQKKSSAAALLQRM